jgi:hypothetical protein
MRQSLESLVTQTIPLSLTHTGNSFMLVVGERVAKQSTCEFLLTFSSMVATDIEAYLSDLSNVYDEVRVPLSSRGDTIILPLADFARLRNLYGQMMFELKLQDLLVRNSICYQAVAVSTV